MNHSLSTVSPNRVRPYRWGGAALPAALSPSMDRAAPEPEPEVPGTGTPGAGVEGGAPEESGEDEERPVVVGDTVTVASQGSADDVSGTQHRGAAPESSAAGRCSTGGAERVFRT